METSEREECGFLSENITAEQCTENGCCFDASVPASVTYASKTIPSQERKECGYQGITRKRCKRIGCCFDLKASGAPTCFHPPVNEASQHCVMEGSARLECGYPGITAEECQAKGCCFNSYDINTRWCFHPLSETGYVEWHPRNEYRVESLASLLMNAWPKDAVMNITSMPKQSPGVSIHMKNKEIILSEEQRCSSILLEGQNADVTLIPRNEPTVDLLGSRPRNVKIQDVASVQQCQESLGASNQPLQN
ncbi:Trefoil factor 2, partial [Ophiophagus hannah]